jgi:hypothetical protein
LAGFGLAPHYLGPIDLRAETVEPRVEFIARGKLRTKGRPAGGVVLQIIEMRGANAVITDSGAATLVREPEPHVWRYQTTLTAPRRPGTYLIRVKMYGVLIDEAPLVVE